MTRSSLPGVLAEIADVAGTEIAWAIAQAQGGITVYIPARPKDNHWLVELVGREAADKISQHFCIGRSGARFDIPTAKYSRGRERLVKALEGWYDGSSGGTCLRNASTISLSGAQTSQKTKAGKLVLIFP